MWLRLHWRRQSGCSSFSTAGGDIVTRLHQDEPHHRPPLQPVSDGGAEAQEREGRHSRGAPLLVIDGRFEIRRLVPPPGLEGTKGPYRNSLRKRFTRRHTSASASTGMVVLHTVLLILIALFALSWAQD